MNDLSTFSEGLGCFIVVVMLISVLAAYFGLIVFLLWILAERARVAEEALHAAASLPACTLLHQAILLL